MPSQFSEDDVGKPVVNANGEEVGMVSAVEGETARVDPDPGVTDTIKAALGWVDAGEDAFPLKANSVKAITDQEVRLAGDGSMRGGGSAENGGGAGVVDRDEGTGRRDVGHATGEIGESDADREPPETETRESHATERDAETRRDAEEQRTGHGRGSDGRRPESDDRSVGNVDRRTDAEVEPTDEARRDDAEMDISEELARDDAETEPTEGARHTDAEIEPIGDPERTDAAVDPEEMGRSESDPDDDREDTVTDARGRDEDR